VIPIFLPRYVPARSFLGSLIIPVQHPPHVVADRPLVMRLAEISRAPFSVPFKNDRCTVPSRFHLLKRGQFTPRFSEFGDRLLAMTAPPRIRSSSFDPVLLLFPGQRFRNPL